MPLKGKKGELGMSPPINAASARMAKGEPALGLIVRLVRTTEIARIARAAGYDFLFIDLQHAAFSLETIAELANAALAVGVAPIVRVRGARDADIPVILDSGALGIVVPDVNTAAEARAAVAAAKFAPIGRRSSGGALPIFDFKPTPLAETLPALNAATLVICMIETREGLANIEEIASVEGVDVLHIGCNDLLIDLGKPGAFGGPEIRDAIARVLAAATKHRRWAGLGGDKDDARQIEFIGQGMRFITTEPDVSFLLQGATRKAAALRAATAKSG